MSKSEISVVCCTGAGIPGFLAAIMFAEAVQMTRSGMEQKRFKAGKFAEGMISTKGDYVSFGGISGRRFWATVDHIGGTSKVS